jgi:hypothetical protein
VDVATANRDWRQDPKGSSWDSEPHCLRWCHTTPFCDSTHHLYCYWTSPGPSFLFDLLIQNKDDSESFFK